MLYNILKYFLLLERYLIKMVPIVIINVQYYHGHKYPIYTWINQGRGVWELDVRDDLFFKKKFALYGSLKLYIDKRYILQLCHNLTTLDLKIKTNSPKLMVLKNLKLIKYRSTNGEQRYAIITISYNMVYEKGHKLFILNGYKYYFAHWSEFQ